MSHLVLGQERPEKNLNFHYSKISGSTQTGNECVPGQPMIYEALSSGKKEVKEIKNSRANISRQKESDNLKFCTENQTNEEKLTNRNLYNTTKEVNKYE